MNIEIFYTMAGSTLAILACMISLFLWLRSEANADRRRIEDTQALDRLEFIGLVRNMESNLQEMRLENKDFHHRLLDIERGRK